MKLLHAVFSLTAKRCFQCLTFSYTLALTQLCSGWLILTKIEFEQQVCGVSVLDGYRSLSPHIENTDIVQKTQNCLSICLTGITYTYGGIIT